MQLSRLARLVFVGSMMVGVGSARADEPQSATASPIDVRASTEVAGYADTDHVFVLSPTVAGTATNPTAGWTLGGRYLVDVVSAASVDIVSTASRRWTEVRHAGSIDTAYKPGDLGVAVSGDVSSEPDYLSLTGGGSITQDILDRNATLLVGYSHGHDIAGRTGTPFEVFSRRLNVDGFKGGATVLLDRATILSLLGDFVLERGDQSKPYRYVPMFNPGTVVPRGASPESVMRLRTSARVLDQLPLGRERYALSTRIAHRFQTMTVRLDERIYADSWAMKATTTDARLIIDLGSRFEVGPHLRFHGQTPVTFWQRAYQVRPGFDYPVLRTGDRELGPLTSVTGGSTLKWAFGPHSHPRAWVLGVEISGTSTQYLDDLYITHRLSSLGVLSLEVER